MASALDTNKLSSLHPRNLIILSVILPAIYIIYLIGKAVYNVYFHPLSAFPGPKSFAATRISHVRSLLRGQLAQTVKGLHDEYGEIVRIAPDELSFTTAQAWRDIYGHRQGHKGLQKDPVFYGLPPEGVHHLVSTPSDADHSRMRRLLAHAFSEKALREQEPLITSYIDTLIDKLRQQILGSEGGKVDLVRWYNFTTFDIVGDLAFGESFHCLEREGYHSWVGLIFKSIKFLAYLQVARRFPPLTEAINLVLPGRLREQRRKRMQYNKDQVDKRLELGKDVDRPDFISYILRHNDEKGMSRLEIQSSAAVLTTAGSETTATLLSGVTFHLLRNPAAYEKLVDEVRTTFKAEEDINSIAVAQLPYLNAVLEEGLRMYPPTPAAIPRVTPPEGDEICGQWIPGNTLVGVPQYAAYRSPQNFALPDAFIPERWLPSTSSSSSSSTAYPNVDFSSDSKQVLQPFSMGPRNCIGRNLAYMEMRIILARVMWAFDLEMCEESRGWDRQEMWIIWEKGPLVVRLQEVVRDQGLMEK